MSQWAKCKTLKGREVYVNLGNALTIMPVQEGKGCRIAFIGAAEEFINVEGTPEELLAAVVKIGSSG
jgi:hypothetical protein